MHIISSTGHASSTTYQNIDTQSADPVSTGKEFEPAGWKPGGETKK